MHSDQVLNALDLCRATPGKNDRTKLVKMFLADPLFRKVVVMALDPFVTFGMSKKTFPDVTGVMSVGWMFDETSNVWAVLDGMAKRELTGNAARDHLAIELGPMGPSSVELVRRIILGDLRAGFSASTVNKIEPGLVPSFDVMLAGAWEPKRVRRWPVVVEPKYDGMRTANFVDEDTSIFFSRGGNEFTTLDHLKDALVAAATDMFTERMVIDCEVVSGSFNDTGVVRSKGTADDAVLHVFDVVPAWLFEENDLKRAAPVDYAGRRLLVEELVGRIADPRIRTTEYKLANSVEEVLEIYRGYRDRGLEGAIVKQTDGRYVRKRTHDWMKIKAEETVDVRVIGAYEGESDSKYVGMLGGLTVDFNGVEVDVGGGYSDEARKNLWRSFQNDYQDNPVGRLIEVEYHEVTPAGSLRHSRFVRFRDDKDKA